MALATSLKINFSIRTPGSLDGNHKIMKKTKFIKSAVVLSILALAGVGIITASAATENSSDSLSFKRGRFGDGPRLEKTEKMARPELTEEQKTEMEAHRAEMEARQSAIQAALENGDYQAWLAAAGEDCPLADKITAENFSQFVEAHQLRQRADGIMEGLGLEGRGNGFGLEGLGNGFGFGPGRGHGSKSGCPGNSNLQE